jgi:hypothetical protein
MGHVSMANIERSLQSTKRKNFKKSFDTVFLEKKLQKDGVVFTDSKNNGGQEGRKDRDSGGKRVESLDKLAQLRKSKNNFSKSDNFFGKVEKTGNNENLESDDPDFKCSVRTKYGDSSTLLKRAKAKNMTHELMYKLINGVPVSVNKPGYWNTLRCAGILALQGEEITTVYCKNRWCLVCNRIRTGKLIHDYLPILQEFGSDKWLVTLTLRNCVADDLSDTMDAMHASFIRIKDVMKKRQTPLVGMRKLECTYNFERGDFHPHYHCIIQGKEEAQILLAEWLKRTPTAEAGGQDIRQANDEAVRELFKYFTKLVSTQKSKRESDGKVTQTREIHLSALDIIFTACKGRRTFQGFGIKLPKKVKAEKPEADSEEAIEKPMADLLYSWNREMSDWVEPTTGEILTGFKPSEAMREVLNRAVTDPVKIRPLELPPEEGINPMWLRLSAPRSGLEDSAAVIRELYEFEEKQKWKKLSKKEKRNKAAIDLFAGYAALTEGDIVLMAIGD